MSQDLVVTGGVKVKPSQCVDIGSQFDYASLSLSVAKFLRGQADRIRRAIGLSVVRLGKDLIEAKRHLSHGAFLNWVESEVGIPARSAQAYMQVAQWAKDKKDNVALLPPSILYVLSAPSTPREFALGVLKRIDAGEGVKLESIRAELKALRGEKKKEPSVKISTVSKNESDYRSDDACVAAANRTIELLNAAMIVARGLSRADFRQVVHILTSRIVLDDHDLGLNLAAAFGKAAQLRDEEVLSSSGKSRGLQCNGCSLAPDDMTPTDFIRNG
jgi:hypothetical protein